MKIKCGLCGEEIVVADELIDGQRILCPYCGGKSEYRKPTRIELPQDVVRQPYDQGAAPKGNGETAQDGDEIPEIPAYKRNPNLYIRRPGENGVNAENGRRNALVDQVTARAKAEARRKLMAKLKKFASNVFALVVLVALAVAGFRFYKSWKGGSGVFSLPDADSRFEEAPGKTADGFATDVPEKKGKKETERGSRGTQNGISDSIASESYEAVKGKFVGCRVSYWGKLPKNERPGAVDGKFHLFVPTRNGVGEYYEIDSVATNAITLIRLTEKPEARKPGDGKEYAKLLTERGGFVMKENVAYLVTPSGSSKSHQAPMRRGEVFDPAEAVFGTAYSAAQKMNVNGLRFEVSFVFDEKDEPRKVAEVRFGNSVPYESFEKVAASLADEIWRKSESLKVKPFKQTVVLYDGLAITRGSGGVTKVPRQGPNPRDNNYGKWRSLRNEALRQEGEAQRSVAEAKRARENWIEATTKRILLAGTVRVKRM